MIIFPEKQIKENNSRKKTEFLKNKQPLKMESVKKKKIYLPLNPGSFI